MRLFFASALVGLTVAVTLSTPASAWQCMARSTNGAVGLGSGIILERAQKFAIRRCIGHAETFRSGELHHSLVILLRGAKLLRELSHSKKMPVIGAGWVIKPLQ